MPDYRYTAQTKNGKQVKGRIKASDEREIRKLVSAKDQTLLYYEEIAKQIALKPLKKSQLSDFCRQMGELIKSGISILRALEIQGSDESITPYEKELYMRLRDRVVQGIALSTAMEELYPAFPPLLVYMFRAAESSGNLDTTALRLADQYQKENKVLIAGRPTGFDGNNNYEGSWIFKKDDTCKHDGSFSTKSLRFFFSRPYGIWRTRRL